MPDESVAAQAGRLRDKVLVVTGAASGIGRATALCAAREGARLVLSDCDSQGLQATAAALEGDHECVVGDVSREDTGRSLAEAAVRRFGRIDVLVNNAGVYRPSDIIETTDADIDDIVGVNVKGMIWCCKHVMPVMEAQGSGSVVIVSSISAVTGQDRPDHSQFLYNITKAAGLQLMLSLATRYAEAGIRVNAVCPGVVQTGILGPASVVLTEHEQSELWAGMARQATPMQRAGHPDEVAWAIVFLASDEASFITGAALAVDGGFLAR